MIYPLDGGPVSEVNYSKPPSYDLPEDSGVITGADTKEEAQKWVAEFKNSISGS